MSGSHLVLGASGQLGHAFLTRLGESAEPLLRAQLDLSDESAVSRFFERATPAVVLNCAAYNFVDQAEQERGAALSLNFSLPASLARLSRRYGWKLVHFSTDYVFGGEPRQQPYSEDDRPHPVNFYGFSKLMGEQAVLSLAPAALVVRVAHLFGGTGGDPRRQNLAQRFLARARAGQPLHTSRTQFLNPTSVDDIVANTLNLVADGASGLFHLTGEGSCTVEEYVQEVLRTAGLPESCRPAGPDPRPTPRPAFSALENRRLNTTTPYRMREWKRALAEYVAGL